MAGLGFGYEEGADNRYATGPRVARAVCQSPARTRWALSYLLSALAPSLVLGHNVLGVGPPGGWSLPNVGMHFRSSGAELFGSKELPSVPTLGLCEELPQEGQLGLVLWPIGVLLGLDDRREIENSHRELRDVEQPSGPRAPEAP